MQQSTSDYLILFLEWTVSLPSHWDEHCIYFYIHYLNTPRFNSFSWIPNINLKSWQLILIPRVISNWAINHSSSCFIGHCLPKSINLNPKD